MNEVIERVWKEMEQMENREALKRSVTVGFLAIVPATLASIILTTWQPFLWIYLCALMFLAVVRCVIEKIPSKYARISNYVFASILLLGSLMTGIIFNPDGVAMAFLVAQLLVGIYLVDKPVRTKIFLVAWGVIFLTSAFVCERGEIRENDVINELIVISVSLFLSHKTYTIRCERIEKSLELELRANYDQLTSLPNRRKFYADAKNISVAGEKVSLFMIDIDWFKQYNDAHGHQAGDYVLGELGKAWEKLKAEGISLYRYGGEEFIGISRGDTATDTQKIFEAVTKCAIPYRESIFKQVTVSIGAAKAFVASDKDVETLIGIADEQLYKSKETRNVYTIAEED